MTDPSYSAVCSAVVEAFVEAFPHHLDARLAVVAPDVDIGEAARRALQWLGGELGQWASLPVGEQRQGPLQILQTAFAFPTAALEALGVGPVDRDPGSTQALPGDVYSLAPISSRELGEPAWRAHVSWGISKAKVFVNAVPGQAPVGSLTLAVVTMNQSDRAVIVRTAENRGIATRSWRNPGAIAAGLDKEIPRWAVVDLDHAAAEAAVRMLANAGSKVAVYGKEPDDIAMARWMAIGAATVTSRDRLVAVVASWLPLHA